MMIFKRKQVVALSLVLMIVVAGYLQYSYKKSSISAAGKDDGKIGEAVYVDNNNLSSTDQKISAKKDIKATKPVSASKQANDFFAQAKMDREISRGKDTDALKQITDDTNAGKEQKAKAYDQMMKIISNSQKEMKVETMVKEKGFSEVFALFADDESLDIVIKTPSLTAAQTAAISDVVSRQANVPITKLHIKSTF